MYVGTPILIVVILILVIIALTVGFFWTYNPANSENDAVSQLGSDFSMIREIMTYDAHLHRLLMIEIIGDKPLAEAKSTDLAETKLPINTISSEMVTFNKMSAGMSLLGKAMVRSFGITIAQKIATLMHKRNEILREYYWSLRNIVCHHGNCVIVSADPNFELSTTHKGASNEAKLESTDEFTGRSSATNTDVTVFTHRKLEAITREITDNIASSFHIRDIDSTNNKNRPLLHYQRLFNLITMYDKELVNQAKSYAAHHYDISMNCASSALDITHHISDELSVLMKESSQKAKIVSP